jgi:hypothetical protein
MAEEHVTVLLKARENFVRKRREMAEQMVPDGAAGAHFAPSFVDLQDAIEALDRAIEDELRLFARQNSDQASGDSRAGAAPGANENVVGITFDP